MAFTSRTASSAAPLPAESPTALSSMTTSVPKSLLRAAPAARFKAKMAGSLSLLKMIFTWPACAMRWANAFTCQPLPTPLQGTGKAKYHRCAVSRPHSRGVPASVLSSSAPKKP